MYCRGGRRKNIKIIKQQMEKSIEVKLNSQEDLCLSRKNCGFKNDRI